jgi:uncharacterized tellurite resistance protein B-like protein
MLTTFKNLFDAITAGHDQQSHDDVNDVLHLAYAVLLVEAMRANAKDDSVERAAVIEALRMQFTLADAELAQLVDLAEQTARSASDYYHFTSSLNEKFTQPQKLHLVEQMWQLAYADTQLDVNQNYLIIKITDLLYVTHDESIDAKMRAKEAVGLL